MQVNANTNNKVSSPRKKWHQPRNDGNGIGVSRRLSIPPFIHSFIHSLLPSEGTATKKNTPIYTPLPSRLSHLIRSHAFGLSRLPSPRPVARLNSVGLVSKRAFQRHATPAQPSWSPFATLHTLRPDSHTHTLSHSHTPPSPSHPRSLARAALTALHL
jgi:hypothetical protein